MLYDIHEILAYIAVGDRYWRRYALVTISRSTLLLHWRRAPTFEDCRSDVNSATNIRNRPCNMVHVGNKNGSWKTAAKSNQNAGVPLLCGVALPRLTILFGVSSSVLKEEYDNLREMVELEIEEDSFMMTDFSEKRFFWIKELIPITSRKRKILL